MFDDKSFEVLRRMINSFGPSGYERETSRIVKEYMKSFSEKIISDKLGSIVCVVKGKSDRPHILLAGHIDEIGFVISGVDQKTGFLSFNTIGGWWDQVLLSQKVVVRTTRGDLLGVIAAKPPHLLNQEERNKVLTKEKMFIDIGTTSMKDTEATGIKIGDPVVPWSPFKLIWNRKVMMGKAFDDRIGTFVIMEAIRKIKENNISHPNTIFGAATVQEEVGLRGAQTVAHLVDPDVGIVLEADISGDVPGIKYFEASAKMGKGPSLVTFDRSMIPNQPLKELVMQTAKEINVPLQLSQIPKGGSDAGRIHLNRVGCPSIVISVPTRHIHSHVGLLSVEDTKHAVNLVVELMKRLDKHTIESLSLV